MSVRSIFLVNDVLLIHKFFRKLFYQEHPKSWGITPATVVMMSFLMTGLMAGLETELLHLVFIQVLMVLALAHKRS